MAGTRKRQAASLKTRGALDAAKQPKVIAGLAKAYPYLFGDCILSRADEICSSAIAYVPMRLGFTGLTAVIDWLSG